VSGEGGFVINEIIEMGESSAGKLLSLAVLGKMA